jgi:hypothetical protein
MGITCYNVYIMINVINRVPTQILQDADNLSKETGIPLRDCIDVLMQAQELPAYKEEYILS